MASSSKKRKRKMRVRLPINGFQVFLSAICPSTNGWMSRSEGLISRDSVKDLWRQCHPIWWLQPNNGCILNGLEHGVLVKSCMVAVLEPLGHKLGNFINVAKTDFIWRILSVLVLSFPISFRAACCLQRAKCIVRATFDQSTYGIHFEPNRCRLHVWDTAEL